MATYETATMEIPEEEQEALLSAINFCLANDVLDPRRQALEHFRSRLAQFRRDHRLKELLLTEGEIQFLMKLVGDYRDAQTSRGRGISGAEHILKKLQKVPI